VGSISFQGLDFENGFLSRDQRPVGHDFIAVNFDPRRHKFEFRLRQSSKNIITTMP